MTYSTDGVTYSNTTGVFPGMAAGSYNLTAKNSGGCISSISSVTVNAQPPTPAAPTASVTAQPTCTLATGTITITAPTGAGMTYSTDGVTYSNTTGVFPGMAAGSYNLTAKNSGGCISSISSVTVNAQPPTPAAPTASVTAQPTCTLATGTITITAPTGAGMTYSTDGVTYSNTTGVFPGMAAGSYNLTAKNSGGCISSISSVTVNAQPPTPAAPTASVTAQPTCTLATGTITITAPTGAGMTYSTDGVTYSNTTGVFPGMAAGSYNLTAKNSSGCISSISSVTVNAQPPTPATPTITAGSSTTFCTGGSVTLTSSAGTSYLWSTGATTASISPTASGSYTVKVTNASGCQSASSAATVVTVNPLPAAPTASVTAQPTCTLATGTITITAPTGAGMTYSTDGVTYSNTTGVFPGMAAGSYNLTAKNSGGCISSISSVTVNAQPPTPAAPTASVTAQPTCTLATGTITITAPTGAGMTYSTDGVTYSNTTGVFPGMAAGSYNLTAKNSGGCISSISSVTVNAQPPTPAAPTASVTAQPTCTLATGTITITAPTGAGMTYSTDGVTYSNTTGVFPGMAAGSYNLTAKNSGGCISSISSVTVNAQPPTPAAPTASVTAQPTCTLATGTITITAPTGAGMTYSTDGVTYSNTTGVFPGMAAGSYNLTAKNSGGCISSISSVTVNAQPPTPAAPTASVTAQPTCTLATGTITITAPTGAGMTYSTDGVTYSNTTGVFPGMAAGSYNLTAKNSGGCISSISSVTVNAQPPTPAAPTASVTAQPTCTLATGTITITAPTGAGMTYSTDGVTYSNTTGVFPGMAAGSYNLTAKNSGGCISSISSVTVNAQPPTPATPTITAGSSTTFCTGGSVTLTSSAGTSYLWSTGATTASISPTASGSYTVKVTNASGCQSASSAATVVTVNPLPAAPTASVTAQPTCTLATGTITITAPTGAGMTYSTDGVTYSNTTGVFPGMAAGSYNLTAKNSGGCISSISSVTVNAQPPTPAAPTASVTAQPTCTLATGTITITAPTGAGMTYSTDGVTYSNTTGVFPGMAAGSYNLTAKNSGGCISSISSVTVNAQPPTPAAPHYHSR